MQDMQQQGIHQGETMHLQSPEISEVTQAMIRAQQEFDPVILDRMGKFSYASVKSIIESTKKHLMKYDIRVEFKEDHDIERNLPLLYTVFTHGPSGQYTASKVMLTVEDADNSHTKSKSQRYGAALTYHMRYSLMASLGIYADTDDIDEHDYTKKSEEAYISEAQVRLLHVKLSNNIECKNVLISQYGSLDKIPRSFFDGILKTIS